jgi:hypothetical protein
VIPKPEEDRVPEVAVVGPLREPDLRDQFATLLGGFD